MVISNDIYCQKFSSTELFCFIFFKNIIYAYVKSTQNVDLEVMTDFLLTTEIMQYNYHVINQ